jgi:hypothetical protein
LHPASRQGPSGEFPQIPVEKYPGPGLIIQYYILKPMHLLMSENYFIVGDEVMKNAGESMENPVTSKDYIPPRVLKMGDIRSGSGSVADCTGDGSSPSDDCEEYGYSAKDACEEYGQGAPNSCYAEGVGAAIKYKE